MAFAQMVAFPTYAKFTTFLVNRIESLRNMTYSVDIETLIHLIRERPCIWDKTRIEYKDRIKIATSWREIFSALRDDFCLLSENEKMAFGNEVQKKWNNIRDSFRKYVVQVKHSSVPITKKYVYYERLKFLNKIYDFEDLKTRKKPTIKSESDDTESDNWETRSGCYDYGEATGDFGDRAPFYGDTTRTDAPEMPHDQEEPPVVDGDEYEAVARPRDQAVASHDQAVASHDQAVASHDQDYQPWKRRRTDEDPHLLFFKGILPHLRDFSDDETISFQMGVLQLIKDTRQGRPKHSSDNPQ